MQILKSKHLCIYKVIIVICFLICLGFSVNAEAKVDTGELVINGADQSVFLVWIKGDTLITKDNGSEASIGPLYVHGWEDYILGLALSHGIVVPTDETTGAPVGKPIHNKLMIVKYFDKCSPLLHQALITSEKLNVVIKFFRVEPTGGQQHYYTIELKDALIVEITSGADVKSVLSDISQYRHTEGVTFVYKTITWTHEILGISFSENWD